VSGQNPGKLSRRATVAIGDGGGRVAELLFCF